MEEEESSRMETENIEDDPIVKEIPVFVSKRLQEQLYVFQYPLCPKWKKVPLNVRKCSVKPQNQSVKLDVQLNTTSSNFDVEKAEEIARRVDGPPDYRKSGKELYFENDILDKISYVSSKSIDDPKNYAAGVYNGREFHITPLKGVLRLKPYHPHLDREAKKKQESKAKEQNEEEAGPSKAQQVMVKFSSRSEGDNSKKSHVTSYKKIMEKDAEEPWVDCDWHPEKSELSELEKPKLYAENTSQFNIADDVKDDDLVDYIRRLVPEDQEQAIIKPSMPSNVLSFSSLKTLPLLEQCKLLLKDAKMISFQQLLMLLAGCEGLTSESLLKTLPQVAVLVRGNWIVKSEILFPNNTFSSISGVPAELMCRARDYILILFTKNQYVERRKVSSVIKVPTEEIKEIFMGISKLRYNRGWELALPIDVEFINKYPDIVQRQNLMWEQREVQLSDFFKETSGRDKKQRRKSKSVSEDPSKSVKRDSHGSVKDNCGNSDTDSGTERNKSSPIAARKNKVAKTAAKCDNIVNNKDDNS